MHSPSQPASRRTAAFVALSFAAGAAVTVGLMRALPDLLPAAPAPPGPVASRVDAAPAWSYAEAVARAAPAVVSVYGIRRRAAGDALSSYPPAAASRSGNGTSLGCAVVIAGPGPGSQLLVTNRHIVDGAESIHAELADGRVIGLDLVGVDPETDLAVLRAPGEALPAIEIGDPGRLRVGDVVLAIGNPFGLGQTVSMGIVSATGRDRLGLTEVEDFIQTDAAINPGNSGGALIDAGGRLVGINTAILSESGLSEGLAFAIPADLARRVAADIAASGAVSRGWLGIAGRGLTPGLAQRYGLRAPHGVLITAVRPRSPAQWAGLRTGDVVSSAAGADVYSTRDLRDMVARVGPAARIALTVWRGSERLTTHLTTAQRPSDAAPLAAAPGAGG